MELQLEAKHISVHQNKCLPDISAARRRSHQCHKECFVGAL